MFHYIPKTGETKPCNAKSPETCPYGVENHAETLEAIQELADRKNKERAEKSKQKFVKQSQKDYISHLLKTDEDFEILDKVEQKTYDKLYNKKLKEISKEFGKNSDEVNNFKSVMSSMGNLTNHNIEIEDVVDENGNTDLEAFYNTDVLDELEVSTEDTDNLMYKNYTEEISK